MKMMPTPRLDEGKIEEKRGEIRKYFHSTFDRYESLFDVLVNDQVFYQQPDPLRHPLVFYFAHTATFFVNKMIAAGLISERVDAHMESMMAIGVDEMSWDDLSSKSYDWPQISEVRAYRNMVRELVDSFITNAKINMPINWDSAMWIVIMGVEHEHIHLETSSVLIRQLPISLVKKDSKWPICPEQSQSRLINSMEKIHAKNVELGRIKPSKTYGWDNEYGSKLVNVNDFKVNKLLISNAEYLEFVQDNGYQNEEYWSLEGWKWRTFKEAEHPTFWIKHTDGFKYRTILEEISLPLSWPVDVNYLEAKAYCVWRSEKDKKEYRLPTEAEWHVFVAQATSDKENIKSEETLSVEKDLTGLHLNLELRQWASSSPVDMHLHNGFGDLLGNVWQWTESTIDGFEGFEVHSSYDDFSVPTFDAKHQIMKGGSFISAGNEAQIYSRYAFRRHFFQHAGFRMIESTQKIEEEINTYESDALVSQYLEFHYGAEYFDVENFPKACIEKIWETCGEKTYEKALDLGCAVGRSSFELAKKIKHVDAIDYSARFIQQAISFQEKGEISFKIPTEGHLFERKSLALETFIQPNLAQNVHFSQGDACNLKPSFTGYDLIFAGNLIDRLYDPAAFLNDISARMNQYGILVITSPYTWLEEFTSKDNWLGGYEEDGQIVKSIDGLRHGLAENFVEMAEAIDVPFVIRETARKHQHTVSQMSFWRKK